MKAYLNDEEIFDYVGYWFDNQALPQTVWLEIDSANGQAIYEAESTDGSTPMRVWEGKAVRFRLPSYLYTKQNCAWILEDLKDEINKIADSYDEEKGFDKTLCEYFQETLENERYTSECEFERERLERE